MTASMRLALLAFVFALSGCVNSDKVYLQNETDDLVPCGPYTVDVLSVPLLLSGYPLEEAAQEALRECVAAYEERNYSQVPAP